MGEALSPHSGREGEAPVALLPEGALNPIVAGEWTHYLLKERLLPREGEVSDGFAGRGGAEPQKRLTPLF